LTEKAEHLARLLSNARRVVVFTGAGISTESGIPDFRSPGGFWTKNRIIYFDEFVRSRDARVEAWTRLFENRGTMQKAEPNAGHRALARLVGEGKVTDIITQNIDGLHQASGIPDERVIELHGNTRHANTARAGRRALVQRAAHEVCTSSTCFQFWVLGFQFLGVGKSVLFYRKA
jgi:NAD-dependent deacetylase